VLHGRPFGSQPHETLELLQTLRRVLEENECKHIAATFGEAGGVVAEPNGAAAPLGVKRATLQGRMHRLGISRTSRPAFR
jgi:transcriptional regulator with GAF, ATPase, and Fis domain